MKVIAAAMIVAGLAGSKMCMAGGGYYGPEPGIRIGGAFLHQESATPNRIREFVTEHTPIRSCVNRESIHIPESMRHQEILKTFIQSQSTNSYADGFIKFLKRGLIDTPSAEDNLKYNLQAQVDAFRSYTRNGITMSEIIVAAVGIALRNSQIVPDLLKVKWAARGNWEVFDNFATFCVESPLPDVPVAAASSPQQRITAVSCSSTLPLPQGSGS